MIAKEKFDELSERLDGTRLSAEFNPGEDDEAEGSVVVKIPAGREHRIGTFRSDETLEAFANNPIDCIFAVGPYAAISCHEDGWIESLIEFAAPVGPSQVWYRAFFGSNIYDGEEPIPIELKSGHLRVTLQPASDALRGYIPFFDDFLRRMSSRGGEPRPLPSIRIDALPFNTNDEATDFLERISSSLFFQIDLLKGLPFSLRRIRERRPFSTSRGVEGELPELLEFPKHEYDAEALAYFWSARAARQSPHFQYLSYYQVVEYYFRTFAKRASADRARQILQDPTFRSDRQSDVTRLIAACETGESLGEREQLRLTITSCLTEQELREWLDESDERKEVLTTKKGKEVSEYSLPLRDTGGGFLNACSQRVYDIRCKIVHSGVTSKEEGEANILPLTHHENVLYSDIDLIEFIAVKVISANAAVLNTKQG